MHANSDDLLIWKSVIEPSLTNLASSKLSIAQWGILLISIHYFAILHDIFVGVTVMATY
jgi:hypothetical protein